VRFQKQFGRIQNPLAYGCRCITPDRVEFASLAAAEAVLRKRLGHALAVVRIDACHRRQILHRDMGRDLAGTNALLHRFGKLFHQSQPARHPAHAAVKAPRQIFEAVAETLFQFRKQPALFECRFLFGKTHRSIQDQRVGFAHVPDDGFDRVATQLLQGNDAFVSVNHQISIRTIRYGDNHDRRLLSGSRQRCHQPPLPVRIPRPQMLIAAVQLMKLQLHSPSSLLAPTLVQAGSGLAPDWGEVGPQALWVQWDKA
jgi:hypothetical protein